MGTMEPISQETINHKADILIQKIKHYLITTFGRVLEEADSDEFYRALCYALREEIMINWQATAQTWTKQNCRMIFYLSMEYLPGRFFNNNIVNLKNVEVVQRGLKKTGSFFFMTFFHMNMIQALEMAV